MAEYFGYKLMLYKVRVWLKLVDHYYNLQNVVQSQNLKFSQNFYTSYVITNWNQVTSMSVS